MSFFFNWLDLEFSDIKSKLNTILQTLPTSSTTQPKNLDLPLPQKIKIKTLSFGSNPPRFELLDVPELSERKFKGVFQFKYDGQLTLTINAEIEINAINLIPFDSFTRPHFVLSDKSTIIPVDFEIKDLKIDALLTAVYVKGEELIVVFNEDPVIDLELKTSIDELIDDDLFESIKRDALIFATELLKDDLPGYLRDARKFRDLNHDNELLEDEVDRFKQINDNEELDDNHETLVKPVLLNFTEYHETLSLTPALELKDVYQRSYLFSKAIDKELENTGSSHATKHIRRKIKIFKLKKASNLPLSISETDSIYSTSSARDYLTSSTDTESNLTSLMTAYNEDSESVSSTVILKTPPPSRSTNNSINSPLSETPELKPTSSSKSHPSTPVHSPLHLTAITETDTQSIASPGEVRPPKTAASLTLGRDQEELTPIERYLVNHHKSTSSYKMIDPYESLLHPRDLGPENDSEEDDSDYGLHSEEDDDLSDSYSLVSGTSSTSNVGTRPLQSKKKSRKKIDKGFRSRVASSNYINLGEFKGFLQKRQADKQNLQLVADNATDGRQ